MAILLTTPRLAYTLIAGSGGAYNVTDNTIIYFGETRAAPPTTQNQRSFGVPRSGTIRTISCHVGVLGTLGSTETSDLSLWVNGAAENALGTIQHDQENETNVFSGLALAVTAGDYLEFEVDHPANFVTNPTTVFYDAEIIIEGA